MSQFGYSTVKKSILKPSNSESVEKPMPKFILKKETEKKLKNDDESIEPYQTPRQKTVRLLDAKDEEFL
jgi:hypothetical protein